MNTTEEASEVYALLADGTTAQIRLAAAADYNAVKAMYEAMSPDNIYLRFFNFSRLSAETEARRICREPEPGNVALLAFAGGELAGIGCYSVLRENSDQAEVAFAVADHMHRRGVATLLLEHLASYARSHGVTTFTAETLTENRAMLKVFADVGLPVVRHAADGVFEMSFLLPSDSPGPTLEGYLDVVADRERTADVASLRHVLAPESIAVIGASREPGTVGHTILGNLRADGYAGRLYAVNPRARQIGGERCVASALDLPEPVDLAVIAVPAASVVDVAEQCGQRGVRSLVVITSGLDTAACADLLAVCRRHGMRLVGPNSFGVSVPATGLNATFATSSPRPGPVGLVSQSGGLGAALADQLSRLGVGISSFASVGGKLDVSGNDMLLWWEQDGVTKLAVLYIESFGDPRKFARTARRVGAGMPVLTVLAGHDIEPGYREALFAQAGIITTSGFGELIETTTLLATQPAPAGRTVAIVSNVGGAGVLAANACAQSGLTVYHPHGLTRRRLRTLIPATGAVTGPVDTTAAISGEAFRQCLELLAAEEDVHAIIALILPTGATGDLTAAIAAADVQVPLTAVVLDQQESVRLLPKTAPSAELRAIPAYAYPETAAAVVARAAAYGAGRSEPRGQLPDFPDVTAAEAHTLLREFLGRTPGGGWLPHAEAAALMRCYGIPLAGRTGGDAASDTGLTVTVADDPVFGPLVTLDAGGAGSGSPAGHAVRLTPLTDADADQLIRSVRPASSLPGHGGAQAADLGALRDLLLRLSRLADDQPEVTEIDLNPVSAGPDGICAADVRVKVTPHEPQDPFLRKLR